MAWPKIKNIIIMILLGTNLCLLLLAVSRSIQDWTMKEQARQDAVLFLEERGIKLAEGAIPKSVKLEPMAVRRSVEQEKALAAALLAGEVVVEERGAEVYRYHNDHGSVQFHSNGEFSAQFASGFLMLDHQDMEEQARQVLKRMEFQGEYVSSSQTEDVTSLVFKEMWEGVPLLSCQATVNYRNGELTSITGGRRLVGRPEPDSGEPITVATGLMKFYTGLNALGDVCSRIDSVTEAYIVGSTLTEPIPLLPAWYITTDTGTYQLDTMSGSLSRVN